MSGGSATRPTPFSDRYGLPLSTDSAAAAGHYRDGIDRHLARDDGAREALLAAVAADPGFALAHAALAVQGAAGDDAATVAGRLRGLAAAATPWERRHVELVVVLLDGQVVRAALLAREQLAEYPRDVLALQRMIVLIEHGGRRDWPERRLRLLEDLAPAYGDDWYFLGALARAHGEAGQPEPARRFAERALAANPRSANAAHALAHVFSDEDEHRAGAAFLDEWLPAYRRAAPYHGHLSWHRALFALAEGDAARVRAIYERDISPAGGAGRGRLLDAASLLWRCRLAATPLDRALWQPVCRLADAWSDGGGRDTTVAHAALAYAGGGDAGALDHLIDGLRRPTAEGDGTGRRIGLALVEGIVAFAAGAYDEAIRLLEPAADELPRLGGSRLQREVFEDTLLDAYLRADRLERAEALVRRRLDRRPSARDRRTLTQALDARADGQDGPPGGDTATAAHAIPQRPRGQDQCVRLIGSA